MALTVKTIKKKPLSLKRDEGEAADAASQTTEIAEEGAAAETPGAAAPAPGRQASYAAQMRRPAYKLSGTCAILAVIILLVLLFLQWSEWEYYHNPEKGKPCFPRPEAFVGGGTSGGTTTPAPAPTSTETNAAPETAPSK